MTQSSHTEATPLSRAASFNMPALSASALLAEAKLLESASSMLFSSTHVETSPPALEVLDRWTVTATTADQFRRTRSRARPLELDEPSVEDHLDQANEQRIELLARQYVAKDKFSSEDLARLAIVTERVRQLLPAVTVAEFEALERNLEAARRASTLLEQLRERLTLLSGKRG